MILIEHPNCSLIKLKVYNSDKNYKKEIIVIKEVDLLIVENFNAVSRELKFLKDIYSRYVSYKVIMKDDNFKYYHDDLIENVKKYLDPYKDKNINIDQIYKKHNIPWIKIKNIFDNFSKLGLIKNGKVIKTSEDLIEPIITII